MNKIIGELVTGFEKRGDRGSFSCGNCHYMEGGGCTQTDMKKHSSQPRLANGNVKVDSGDCCEFVDRKGPKVVQLHRYRTG
jgi:hypothetical protein